MLLVAHRLAHQTYSSRNGQQQTTASCCSSRSSCMTQMRSASFASKAGPGTGPVAGWDTLAGFHTFSCWPASKLVLACSRASQCTAEKYSNCLAAVEVVLTSFCRQLYLSVQDRSEGSHSQTQNCWTAAAAVNITALMAADCGSFNSVSSGCCWPGCGSFAYCYPSKGVMYMARTNLCSHGV